MINERFPWGTFESIPSVDRKTAELILKPYPEAPFPLAVVLAYIVAALRAGYFYVEWAEDRLYPELEKVWPHDESLLQTIFEGCKQLPESLVSLHTDSNFDKPLVRKENSYYLQRSFLQQRACFNEWERLKQAEPLHKCNDFNTLKSTLTEEQQRAVELGCKSLVFILTGGPGTGKTYTAGRLLDTLQKSMNGPKEIALAAPTGKAALTLEKALSSCFQGDVKAKTLHALLGVKGDGSFSRTITALPYDIYLIDEASMIDMELMTQLFASIKSGAKLILMGDPYQLPPVDGCPIFPLLAKSHLEKVELTRCLRAETLELVTFAEAIRLNKPIQSGAAIEFLDAEQSLEAVLAAYLHKFPILNDATPESWLQAFQKFRILTPHKVGPGGSIAVNRWISTRLAKDGVHAIPLMITANDYRMELFNGEVGVLITAEREIPEHFSENDYVYFPSGKKIPALLLPPYELAYAMTVHKSQGSEFEEVLLLLPETKKPVSIPLLYTAVTRARKKITLWNYSWGETIK
jgi:exodeoxyribonuclease V alpha subunit